MTSKLPPLKLGRIVNTKRLLTLSEEDLRTHLYIAGGSRRGKTKFIENILRQIIIGQRNNGPGLLLLDPHGTLYHDLAAFLTDHRIGLKRRVLFVDPSRDDFVVPFNILRRRHDADGREAEPSVVARQVLRALAYVWGAPSTQDTPRLHRHALNLLLTLYVKGYTTNEAYHYLHAFDRELRRALTQDIALPSVAAHWNLVNTMIQRDFLEAVESTMNRFEPLVSQPRLTRMFGHPDRSIDFRRALDEGWIILCNLATEGSQLDEDDAHLLGTLLLADLWATAKDRGKASGEAITYMRPFIVAIDEMQNFITPTIAKNLAEASGFGLRMILAHQYPGQLTDDPKHAEHGRLLFKSILTNAANKVVFGGLGHDDDIGPLADVLYRGVLDPDQVKLTLYGTKPVDYRVVYQKAYSRSTSTASGSSTSTATMTGSSHARSGTHGVGQTYDADGNILGTSYSTADMDAFTSNIAQTLGQAESWSDSSTEGESDIPMLMPVLGKEVQSVQYRNLEEQRYMVMAALFDQQQRQCVVRLAGMQEPASIFTPKVADAFSRPKTVDSFIATSYRDWPDLALPAPEATDLVEQRRRQIVDELATLQAGSQEDAPERAIMKTPAPMLDAPSDKTQTIKLPGIHLSPQDQAILSDVFETRFTTIYHVSQLYFRHRKDPSQGAKEVLRRMVDAELLEPKRGSFGYARLRDGSTQEIRTVYIFQKKALDTLIKANILPEFPKEEWSRLRKRYQGIRTKTFQHEAGMLDVKLMLQIALEGHPRFRIQEFGIWPYPYRFKAPPGAEKDHQEPDGFLHLIEHVRPGLPPVHHYFYIEFDNHSNEDRNKIVEKAHAYNYHDEHGGFRRFLRAPQDAHRRDYPFRVCFVVESPDAAKRRDNIAIRLAQEGYSTRFPITTLAEFCADPLGPIWVLPRDYAPDAAPGIQKMALFESLSTSPEPSEVSQPVLD